MSADVLQGLILMLVLGPIAGSYACSFIYRLPRGMTPFERHPFCGHCGHKLETIDLFPLVSWLKSRGQCRYCHGRIPGIYPVIEAISLVVFIAYYIHFGVGEPLILYLLFAVFVLILAAIDWEHHYIAANIYGYALTAIALARTLNEQSIYGFIKTGFVMLVIVLAGMRLAGNKANPFTKPWVWWFVLLGALTPFSYWAWLLPVYPIKLLLPKRYRVWVYAAWALTLPLV